MNYLAQVSESRSRFKILYPAAQSEDEVSVPSCPEPDISDQINEVATLFTSPAVQAAPNEAVSSISQISPAPVSEIQTPTTPVLAARPLSLCALSPAK